MSVHDVCDSGSDVDFIPPRSKSCTDAAVAVDGFFDAVLEQEGDLRRGKFRGRKQPAPRRTKIVFDSSDDDAEDAAGGKDAAGKSGLAAGRVVDVDGSACMEELSHGDFQDSDVGSDGIMNFAEDIPNMDAGSDCSDDGGIAAIKNARVVAVERGAGLRGKRWRDDDDDDDQSENSDGEGEGHTDHPGNGGEGRSIENQPPQVLLSKEGYNLAVDESLLMEECGPAEGDSDSAEDDDEEDEEMIDDMRLIAAIEQMIAGCRAEEDPAVKSKFDRFIEKAESLLEECVDGIKKPEDIAQELARDISFVQRQLRMAQRPPKPDPIVINGVQMDM